MKKLMLAVFVLAVVLAALPVVTGNLETKDLNDDVRRELGRKFMKLSDGMVHYDVSGPGKGELVVLVHGNAAPYFSWDKNLQALTGASFRVVRYDLYGFGYSERPDVNYSRELYDRQLSEVLAKLNIKGPVNLVGTSPGGSMRSVTAAGNNVSLATTSALRIYSTQGVLQREITGYASGTANPVTATVTGQTLWIADASAGLVATDDYSTYVSHTLPGPYTNNVADIHFAGNNFYVTGGTVDNAWGNVYRPLQVFTGSGDKWSSTILYRTEDRDAMRVISDPEDESRYFVSSWGNGLYEFRDDEMVMNYNQENSPLSSIIPGENFTRICGLAFDRDGNLWMTQSGVPGNLKALTPDGNWISTSLNLGVPVTGDMVIDRNGFIWVILPRGYGLLVYDPAGTPATLTDDRYLRLQVTDTEGHVMNNLFSIAADSDGSIWLGTDMGPAVYYNPGKAFTGELKATRIKIPRNDGSGLADYLLGTETVTTICVDGADRKWLGTMSSGAWLMSDDGKEELIHFNSSNSPLLSDNIVKINVNPVSGEVWFGTSEGIISFRGDATAGKEDFSSVYVFPNPVREDFEGVVTVTGLVENSSVKITDISGNLVYETTSTGGQATWDLRNYRSERAATGVYLVFCSNEDGSLARVIKMLVIR